MFCPSARETGLADCTDKGELGMKKNRTREDSKQTSVSRTKQYEMLKEIIKKSSVKIAAQERRVQQILGAEEGELPGVSEKTLARFRDYLATNIDFSCLVTGRECFKWEEYFIFGPGKEDAYEELKKKQPSYKDQYKIVKLYEDPLDAFEGIIVRVQRASDRKRFDLPLADLEALDKDGKTREALDDYAFWFVNCR
jgi:hypothetical protein